MGGVPIIKYRVEWRLPGQAWTSSEHDAKDGESHVTPGRRSLDGCFVPPVGCQKHVLRTL